MKNKFFLILFPFFLFSCAVPNKPNTYDVPKFIKISHEEVMTQDFPTKKSVFMKFGTPTNKETFENIENWYFKLSEITSSKTIGLSTGAGLITQNPMNPYLTNSNKGLIINQNQINTQKTNSTTVETYVKFWFINDSVPKWETLGVDYSKLVPNTNYDENEAMKSDDNIKKWQERSTQIEQRRGSLVIGSVMLSLMIYLLVF